MACVLIVDDDEVTRRILGRMLEDAGHEVVYAYDGAAALRAFRLGRFDAVFTDLAMPEKNGFLLMRELQEQDPRLPVIAMSGENAENLIMAEDFGATRILYKPLEPETVLGIMNRIVEEMNTDIWHRAQG